MFTHGSLFTAANLSCNPRQISVFIEQWKAVRAQRNARYKLGFHIPLNGTPYVQVSVICLDEIEPGVYLLEAAPLDSNRQLRHYFSLSQTAEGGWQFSEVLAITDPGNHRPSERARIIRECFVK